jgi:hypothetical protein
MTVQAMPAVDQLLAELSMPDRSNVMIEIQRISSSSFYGLGVGFTISHCKILNYGEVSNSCSLSKNSRKGQCSGWTVAEEEYGGGGGGGGRQKKCQ